MAVVETMRLATMLVVLVGSGWVADTTRIAVTPDGGYKNIVVKIGEDVNEEDCKEIIDRVKVSGDRDTYATG